MTHPLWPLFDLVIRSNRLELRLPTDDELIDLGSVARAGIHGGTEIEVVGLDRCRDLFGGR